MHAIPARFHLALLALALALLVWAPASKAANPSASLDQCANGPAPSPSTDGCDSSASDWVNGNVNGSKANYLEGDSLPYRMTFGNLSTSGSHQVTIEWDTTKGGKHAIDYLTSYDRTVATAKPCLGVSGCSASTTFPIPADPQVTGAGVTPVAGAFTMFGGTITAVGAYSGGAAFPSGDNTRTITITFTAAVANPVLAWGGHIASRADWGAGNSAVAIPGSPFHTRLIALDGAGGNQDRALSADAVVYPGSITITKDAIPDGSTAFAFTASPAPLAGFSLVDDGTAARTKAFPGIVNFTTYTVAESVPSGWSLTGVKCSVSGGISTTPPSTSTATLSIALQEGDDVACTYTDERQGATLIVVKDVINDNGGAKSAGDFTMTVSGVTTSGASTFPGAASPGTSVELASVGSYTVAEGAHAGYAVQYSADCTGTIAWGETKTCTITNDDIAPVLHLVKKVVNDNGGTAVPADWTLTALGTDGNDVSGPAPVDSGKGLEADTWTLSELGPKGYAASDWTCDGGKQDGAEITLAVGEEATCTIANDDIAPMLTVIKQVDNNGVADAVPADFTLGVKGDSATPASFPGDADGTDVTLDAGTFLVEETDGPGGYAQAFDGDCSGEIAVGQHLVCTVTNTRLTGTITLVKSLVPSTDSGLFDLQLDGDTAKADVGDGGSAGPITVATGTHAVAELAGTGTSLDDYASSVDCVTQETPKAPRQPVAGTSTEIAVGAGDDVVCTFTNERKGTITLIKSLVPATDPGLVDLLIGDTTVASDVGAGGTSGALTRDAGTYTVSELAGTGTDLALYTSTVTCTDGGDTPIVDALAGTSAQFDLANGQDVVCTFANTRHGTLEVRKVLSPTTNTGLFGLSITGTAFAAAVTDVGNNGTTGAQSVTAGTYTVAETAGTGTSLASYTPSLTCTADGVAITGLSGLAATTAAVPVADAQTVICTFTNTAVVPVTPLIAPPVTPLIAPPVALRGAASLRGVTGCTAPGAKVTRVSGRNMRKVAFYRNGRFVKTVKVGSTALRTVTLRTMLAPTDFTMHTVVARVTFVQGASPKTKLMLHRFAQCRSQVTG